MDEIHALVPHQARRAPGALAGAAGARCAGRPLQRIGLSATQRPLDEVARFLGGAQPRPARERSRNARAAAVERRSDREEFDGGSAAPVPAGHDRGRRREEAARPARRGAGRGHGAARRARWRSRAGRPRRGRCAARSGPRSTRACWSWSARTAPRSSSSTAAGSAERLAAALNELAGETLVPRAPRLASPASSAWRSRTRSRRASCRRWSPPRRWSWASTWARSIWWSRSRRRPRWPAGCSASGAPATRSARRAAASSSPSTAATWSPAPRSPARCTTGQVEATRYPRNPLDVLAQQIVAMVRDGRRGSVDDLYALVRAAPRRSRS